MDGSLCSRRGFLLATGAAAGSLASGSLRAAPAARRPPRILLRSSWQVVNIGDVAHTPGVLALIQEHIPEAETVLWASGDLSADVAAMEQRRFPGLRIVKGSIGADGRASNAELADAIDRADFLLHGSGPSFVAEKDVTAFVKHTGKPFGVYGITYGGARPETQALLGQARFVFCRDSVSLEKAKADGIQAPVLGFAPDGAFACDVRNDQAASAFLAAHDLQEGRFLCCIPRLRFTPYWTLGKRPFDEDRNRRNEAMKEHDHAPLRDALGALVRQTGMKVLIVPEDKTQMAVGKEMILDRLPADVRPQVVWRESFWLTDEALSTYVRSAGLFGLEMHSPILCVGNGIPAIVCRFAEQTSKGLMWRDIGLGDWLFDADRPDEMARFTPTVLSLVTDPQGTRERLAAARAAVRRHQRETMAVLRQCLGL